MGTFLALAAAAALGLTAAGTASATPIRIYSAAGTASTAHGEFALFPYGGTRCKVNVWASVWRADGSRMVARLGRNSLDGCKDTTWTVDIPARMARGGRYALVLIAINDDNYGQAIRHVAVRRFTAR